MSTNVNVTELSNYIAIDLNAVFVICCRFMIVNEIHKINFRNGTSTQPLCNRPNLKILSNNDCFIWKMTSDFRFESLKIPTFIQRKKLIRRSLKKSVHD